jgi:dethiobiotin synthetase
MSAYFITSTGTDIGKTFTTCALLHGAQNSGRAARAIKPLITGWKDGAANDTQALIEAANIGQTVAEVSPLRFAAPLSPHRAAVMDNASIDTHALEQKCHQEIMATPRDALLLIEGAGGVMVPIAPPYGMLDLMAALRVPAILVVGSYLGTISHTLTALAALQMRLIPVHAVVMCESAGSSVTLNEAEAGLFPLLPHLPLRVVQPLVSSWREANEIQALARQL